LDYLTIDKAHKRSNIFSLYATCSVIKKMRMTAAGQ